MVKSIISLIFIFNTFQFCFSQDTLRNIRLSKGKKTSVIRFYDEVEVLNKKTFLHKDSMERTLTGNFLFVTNDSIAIKPIWLRDIRFYDHSGQINIDDWYKYRNFCANQDTAIKVSLKELNYIHYNRQKAPRVFRYSFFASAATALIVSPLVSIERGGFNRSRFRTISSISGGAAVIFCVCLGISLEKEHFLKAKKSKTKVWEIKY